MLTSTQAAVLNNKLAGQLEAVGAGFMPTSKHNTESHAWNFLVASKIESFGKKLKDKARKDAVKAGVMFDHEKLPMAPTGEEVVFVYSGDVVRIKVQVKQPSQTVDSAKLISLVQATGLVPEADLMKMVVDATKESRAAHTFTAELLTA